MAMSILNNDYNDDDDDDDDDGNKDSGSGSGDRTTQMFGWVG